MINSSFKLENKLLAEGYDFVIGIDEAGRGPLAGPVVAVAAAVRNFQFSIFNFQSIPNDIISNDKDFERKSKLIRDSKTLSERQRESLFDFIHENFYVGVGICDHMTIDRINILEATYLAMKKAITNLNKNILECHSRESGNLVYKINLKDWIPVFTRMTKEERIKSEKKAKNRCIILVDGNKVIPNLSMEQKAIVNGDKIVKSISAASIVAKVTRDRIMREMDKKYPEYQFAKHKGYGTKTHMEKLKKHGPCEIHRRSFRPVKRVSSI